MVDFITAIVTVLVILGGVWVTGKRSGKKDAEAKQDKEELEAHERISNVDTGDALDDDNRRERLRDLADRLRD